MRAWRVHELGDPSKVLSLDEIDQPTPGEGQVLVKVKAAALTPPREGVFAARRALSLAPWVSVVGNEVAGYRHNEQVVAEL